MNYAIGYRCTLCGNEYGVSKYGNELMTCPHCGERGILDVVYDYDAMRKVFSHEQLRRSADYTMWRYAPLMPLSGEDYTRYLRIGWTPLYNSNRLKDAFGLKRLYIKDEGVNPTASLKDRASGVAVAKAIELGYDTVACSSTGNAASSLAGSCARMGLKSFIFVPDRAPDGKLAQLLIYGARLVAVKGDYRATFELSEAAIKRYGWYNRNAGINPVLTEGKKTVAFEIAEQLRFDVTDWVAVSVGDGCTVGAVYNGFSELLRLGMLERIPRILGVQSSGCCPFVNAKKRGGVLQAEVENTIADSIAVGIPRNPIKAQRAIALSKGEWIAVSDNAIMDTMRLLGSTEGLFAEPAAAAAVAGVYQAIQLNLIKGCETVTVISTGNGLKDVKNGLRAAGKPLYCEPSLDAFEASGILC